MTTNTARVRDEVSYHLERGRALAEEMGATGWGVATLTGPDGEVQLTVPFTNLITTAGDEYYAKKACVSVGDYGTTAPTAANGMKLSTQTTTAAKSGAGSYIASGYISGSNAAFVASHPVTAAVGGDGGYNVVYECTWAAGTATADPTGISIVCLVVDQATNDAGSESETYAYAKFGSPVVKASDAALTITWNHKLLGAV